MREIKFRAWLKYKKEMVDNARPDFFSKQLHYLSDNDAGGKDVLGVSTEDIELMQYTGLKDMREKEIYEGDILSDVNDEKPYKVIFENGSFRAEFERDFEVYSLELIEVSHFCEIVGNIYENYELLGANK